MTDFEMTAILLESDSGAVMKAVFNAPVTALQSQQVLRASFGWG
jgi:hypothetical protein